jgi:hypothetical protein
MQPTIGQPICYKIAFAKRLHFFLKTEKNFGFIKLKYFLAQR